MFDYNVTAKLIKLANVIRAIGKLNYLKPVSLSLVLWGTAVLSPSLLMKGPPGFSLSKKISYITGIIITLLSLSGFIFIMRKNNPKKLTAL